MDKEYIAMCNCPEIQEKWEPKVGDRMVFKDESEEQIVDDIAIRYAKDYPQENVIYIPRIEDVLEWLGDGFRTLQLSNSGFVCFFYHTSSRRTFKSKWADTAVKAVLKAYMHLLYNKTWNGEAWA